jgi:hypothetical protein
MAGSNGVSKNGGKEEYPLLQPTYQHMHIARTAPAPALLVNYCP